MIQVFASSTLVPYRETTTPYQVWLTFNLVSFITQNSNLFYLVSPLVLGCTLLSLVDIQSDRPELPSLKTFQSSENVDYEPEEEKVIIEMF